MQSFQYVADEVFKRFIKDQTDFKSGIRPSRTSSIASEIAKNA